MRSLSKTVHCSMGAPMKRALTILFFTCSLIFINTGPARATLINYDNTGHQYPDEILNYYSGLPGSPNHSPGFMWLDLEGITDPTYGPHSLTATAFSFETNPVSVSWGEDVTNVNFWYGYTNFGGKTLSILPPDIPSQMKNNSKPVVRHFPAFS